MVLEVASSEQCWPVLLHWFTLPDPHRVPLRQIRAPYASGPRRSLLSPLNRLQTFFQLVSETRDNSSGNRWLVPRGALAKGKLAITPDSIVAWATAEFELRNITLHDYVLKAVR